MTGITYAITEIVLFLAIAAGLGFFIGRLTGGTSSVPTSDAPRIKDLEAQVASLQTSAAATNADPEPKDAALRKDLEVAVWEIEALQEEIVRLRKDNASADDGNDDLADEDVSSEDDGIAEEDAASEEE